VNVERQVSFSVVQFVDRLLARWLRGLLPEEKRYWLLVPLTGVVSGFLAVILVRLLGFIQILGWGESRSPAEAAALPRVLVPVIGGLAVALYGCFRARHHRFEGTAQLIEALSVGKGRIPLGKTIGSALISITAVGSGASLGREGALIRSGAAFGSWFGSTFRLRDHHVKALLACGAAGGIAASYNVPIGATVFAMEVLLGSLALDLFGPIIICSVIATAISRAFLSEYPAYVIPPEVLDTYRLVNEWEIVLTLLLGGIIGLVSVLFIRVFTGLRGLFGWFEPLKVARPVIAMCALGVVGIWFPELFGNGYRTVNSVLRGEAGVVGASWLKLLIVLPVLKIVLTALCRAGGVPGGLFTPSLFVGALLGFGFGAGVNEFLPSEATAPPSVYALAAMGAMIAGTMQAPITAILMIFEMTQNYAVILPLMAACVASAIVSRLVQSGSLYTEPLRQHGIHLPNASAPVWLRQPTVKDFTKSEVDTVRAAEPFSVVMEAFLRTSQENNRLYVVRDDRTYLGVVSLHEIKTFFRESEHLDTVIAADILNQYFPVVYSADPMSTAVEILAEHEAERLPVLDNPNDRKLIGSVSKRDLLAVYRETSLARIESGR